MYVHTHVRQQVLMKSYAPCRQHKLCLLCVKCEGQAHVCDETVVHLSTMSWNFGICVFVELVSSEVAVCQQGMHDVVRASREQALVQPVLQTSSPEQAKAVACGFRMQPLLDKTSLSKVGQVADELWLNDESRRRPYVPALAHEQA